MSLNLLEDALQLMVMTSLSDEDLIKLSLTNTKYQSLTKDVEFWRNRMRIMKPEYSNLFDYAVDLFPNQSIIKLYDQILNAKAAKGSEFLISKERIFYDLPLREIGLYNYFIRLFGDSSVYLNFLAQGLAKLSPSSAKFKILSDKLIEMFNIEHFNQFFSLGLGLIGIDLKDESVISDKYYHSLLNSQYNMNITTNEIGLSKLNDLYDSFGQVTYYNQYLYYLGNIDDLERLRDAFEHGHLFVILNETNPQLILDIIYPPNAEELDYYFYQFRNFNIYYYLRFHSNLYFQT